MALDPELIPEPLWNISAASVLGRKSKAWREIRSSALQAAENTCSSCGEATPGGKYMVCDELWSYDEQQDVATFTGVRILCPACDHARHFARAGQLGKGADALDTLARVNGISQEQARKQQTEALTLWKRRSGRAWTVQVSESLLAAHPALAVLTGRRGTPGEGRAKVTRADQASTERTREPR